MTTATRMLDRQIEVRDWTIRKGWRGGAAPQRSFGDDMSLLHSEVSEAIEAYRLYKLKRWSVYDDGWSLVGASAQFLKDGSFDYHNEKPEGVASELADVLIRLLDNYAEWGFEVGDSDVEYVDEERYENFGDAMSALHAEISNTYSAWKAYREMSLSFKKEIIKDRFDTILMELQIICYWLKIDLYAEYEAKMKYNETREHRHGGKNL